MIRRLTTALLKVTKMVNRVLDQLERGGQLHCSPENAAIMTNGLNGTYHTNGQVVQLTRRQHILKELVDTERQYVHHLNNLQELKKDLEQAGALTGDSIHAIFLNLTNLVDFAQRFGIRVEQHSELADEQQNWGALFIKYKEAFSQYIPFIANTSKCEETCQREWEKMRAAICTPLMEQMLANPQTLNVFLIKPFQRLTKYPMFLKDLSKQIADPYLKADLDQAVKHVEDVLDQANASIDRETRRMALIDLQERVEDWRALKVQQFGDLMLFGTFTIQKGDSGKDSEKEYHLYLFEAILLCCKDFNQNKQKKLMGGNKEKSTTTAKGKTKMMLKGRIFLANITDIATFQRQGNYSLQIFWKGDSGVENFMIKYKNEETLKKWDTQIETLRGVMSRNLRARSNGTSDTQFTYMQNVRIENPHQELDDDDDEDPRNGNVQSEFSMSRNASSTSLRSRSATNGSGGSTNTYPSGRPPRFPMPDPGSLPPLNTNIIPSQPSPGNQMPQSYFSPITERDSSTPISASARSSSQSAFAGYNRYGTPVNNWPHPEESNRNTAPAMSRSMSRDPSQGNPYLVNGRNTRPSLPPHPNGQQVPASAMNSNRMRSASSPDIHQNLPSNRRYPNGQPMASGEYVPNVPPIPPHVAGRVVPVNRSQNNSPTNGVPLSIRTASPAAPSQYHMAPRPALASHYTESATMYQPRADPRIDPRSIMTINTPSTTASDRTFSPPLPTSSSISTASTFVEHDDSMPSQLKAKVLFDSNYITLIVPRNIQFRSLTDRIDAKLGRLTSQSIGSNSLRLRYKDEDGDFIWIDSDEAVQEAFLDWRESNVDKISAGTGDEILLYCHSVIGEPIATN